MNLNEQAKKILEIAEKHGVEQNFLFITTFKRYQVQLLMLTNLERTIASEPTLISKEYVKGRGNMYVHPAINEYNKTAHGANQTASTLIKIIKTLREENNDKEDELIKFLTRGN